MFLCGIIFPEILASRKGLRLSVVNGGVVGLGLIPWSCVGSVLILATSVLSSLSLVGVGVGVGVGWRRTR